jgi:pSer/pThr/pTyr-binding forkhead associated (FHA) protein
MNGLATRPDLPRSPVLRTRLDPPAVARRDARRGANGHVAAPPPPQAPQLGPYAPLVNAIREELETFVVSHLRLHLAIAERDRYLLTSIDVQATTSGENDELLRRFTREFRPEQIKHYLEKEVIGALPNASAIDLTQFAGLNAGSGDEDAEDDDSYSELLAELKSAKPAPNLRPFEVSLVGRWSEHAPGEARHAGTPHTPLAGRNVEIAIEDADGPRHVLLRAVVPGRRYSIGKGEGCDIAVNGVYASRRHCEAWLEHGAWWVTDAGSTNGVRVERGTSVLGRSASSNPGGASAVEVTDGARIVLSAHADGPPADYPCVVLDVGREVSVAATPIAPATSAPTTPSTPIIKTRPREGFVITARTASGVHTVEFSGEGLPFSVGRSRSQSLVIDWAHEGVSGHHADITEIDDEGVTVVVHGDNGVSCKGKSYPPGARLRWQPGDSITLGRTIGSEPQCHLTLSRHA